jgi:Fic-DOC domain mobile mystery protein B
MKLGPYRNPYGDGQTLLTPDEEADLIPALTTRMELNEWERLNILEASRWALKARNRNDPVSEAYVRTLHRKMFDQTWKWAGHYRSTERNLGVAPHMIREQLAALLGDVAYWVSHETYDADEIAVRLHHRLVWVHPFANGNGRHARLMADVLVSRLGRTAFSWGARAMKDGRIADVGELRRSYIDTLKAADGGKVGPLVVFARS